MQGFSNISNIRGVGDQSEFMESQEVDKILAEGD